jgi:hypothetical protein
MMRRFLASWIHWNQSKEVFGNFYFGQQPTRGGPFVLTDLGLWNGFGKAVAIWPEKKVYRQRVPSMDGALRIPN